MCLVMTLSSFGRVGALDTFYPGAKTYDQLPELGRGGGETLTL